VSATDRGDLSAEDIDEHFVFAPQAGAASVELDGELVIAGAPGESQPWDAHWLNASASILWATFDGEASLTQIIDDLSSAFAIDRSVVHDDVLKCVQALWCAGLLVGVARAAPGPAGQLASEG